MIKCYGTLNSLSTNFNPSVYPLTTTWQKLFLLLTKIFLSKLTQSPQSCSMQWCAGCGCGLQAAACRARTAVLQYVDNNGCKSLQAELLQTLAAR